MTSLSSGIRPFRAAGDASRSAEEVQGCSLSSFSDERSLVGLSLVLRLSPTRLIAQ